MELASATGLAAAILELATFSAKVLSRSQELYKAADGTLLHHNELTFVAKNFNSSLATLESKSTSADTSLNVLAARVQGVTQELLDLLDRLRVQPQPKRRWKSIRQALLIVLKDSQLRELEQRLEYYRNHIDSALMHDLR